MADDEMVGRMQIERVVYLALMDELLEERYGDAFIQMCDAVQEEMMLVTNGVPLHVAIACVNKKFESAGTYSLKQGLIKAMQLPEKHLMS